MTADPGAVSWGPNRIDVFIRGNDNALWHIDFNGTAWSGWENLGGSLTSGPDAASWASGRLDIFVRGPGNGLYHMVGGSGGWSSWGKPGGQPDLGSGGSLLGPQPHRHLRPRGRQRPLAIRLDGQ